MKKKSLSLAAAGVVMLASVGVSSAAELWIGAAEADITPHRPVSWPGQFHVRVADPKQILSRCKANVLAI